MITPKRKLGNLGEKIAANYLKKYGYQIIETNWQIDVILIELNMLNRKANLRHIQNAVF